MFIQQLICKCLKTKCPNCKKRSTIKEFDIPEEEYVRLKISAKCPICRTYLQSNVPMLLLALLPMIVFAVYSEELILNTLSSNDWVLSIVVLISWMTYIVSFHLFKRARS